MGGLGNGRRGGRSPPILIGALVACILVLGFNYWVSSSRNLELQTKLYDLESQVRRREVERGAAEMKKNEDDIQRQKKQMEHLESLYKRQMEGAQNTCSQEKGTLQKNISSGTKTIQQLKGQVNQLNDDLGRLQKELQGCQNNIKTLNKKLTYDMTHCNAELMAQKELCEERVAAAKHEVETKMKKLSPSQGESLQLENSLDKVEKISEALQEEGKAPKDLNQTSSSSSQTKKSKAPELLTNDIVVDEEKASKEEPHSLPTGGADKMDVLPPPPGGAGGADEGDPKNAEILKNDLAEDEKIEVLDSHNEAEQTEEREPDMEGIFMGKKKEEENPAAQRTEEPLEYMAEEQGMEGLSVEKQRRKQPENLDLEQELADYNGDDENEGEFEADKQAELAQI